METVDAKNPFEQDLAKIAEILPAKEAPANPEAHKEAIRAALKAESASAGNGTVSNVPQGESKSAFSKDLPEYLATEGPAVQTAVQGLVNMARARGLGAAFRRAKQSSNLVADAFHDALTDHVYAELKSRGRL